MIYNVSGLTIHENNMRYLILLSILCLHAFAYKRTETDALSGDYF